MENNSTIVIIEEPKIQFLNYDNIEELEGILEN
jgi:hypothetical protein